MEVKQDDCEPLTGPRLNMVPDPPQEEMAELQRRLAELSDRSRCLQQQIQREEHEAEAEELESAVLRSCTAAQLCSMSRTLQDLVGAESRGQISVAPPASELRSAATTAVNRLITGGRHHK